MSSGIIVADVMTRNPITIEPDANLLECAKKMIKERKVCLPITKNGDFFGIVTQRDILWVLVKRPKADFKKIKVIEISSRKIISVSPNIPITKAIKKMKNFNRLPVLVKNKIVGLITVADVLAFKPEFIPEIEEIREIREETEKLKRLKSKTRQREGICEECGNYEILVSKGGVFICENCAKE